jgi:hypothetical protein
MVKLDSQHAAVSKDTRGLMLAVAIVGWLAFALVGFPMSCASFPHGGPIEFTWTGSISLVMAISLSAVYLRVSRRTVDIDKQSMLVTVINGSSRDTRTLGTFDSLRIEPRERRVLSGYALVLGGAGGQATLLSALDKAVLLDDARTISQWLGLPLEGS